MRTLLLLIKRNVKMFFNDKGMFLTSLITPLILLVLYVTFLGNVYRESIVASIPESISISEGVIDGLVGGQLISSILAVSCVTVAFCSNFLIVQDKALGNIKDISISSVNKTTLVISYYISSIISTLIICFIAMIGCLIYISSVGWYLSFSDVVLLFLDVFLLVLFGTAISSVINHFLTTLGQISAVGTIVSSGYGFLCGAYMPVSQFGIGLQKVLSFFPGTYGTSLVRTHAMQGSLLALENEGVPSEVVQGIKDAMDCDIYFFDVKVDDISKYIVLISSIILLLVIAVLLNKYKKEK